MQALLLFLGFLGLWSPPSLEVQVPRNDGFVTDLAGLLNSSQEKELEFLMESYKSGTSHEIALLTVPDLGGESIERFALEVGRTWGIGGQEKNNGALLLVSKGDRKMRIEVGRGLEGGLTDAIASRIIRDVITPAFKAGNFSGGLRAGVMAMHAAIGGDYAAIENSRGRRRSKGSRGGSLAVLVLIIVMFVLNRAGGRGGRGGRGGGMGIWPWLWLASSMNGGRSSFHSGGGFGGSSGGGFGGGGGGFSGFGGGGGFSGGGASGGW